MARPFAAVVGAGPMGLWTAKHLKSRGYSVAVYDRDRGRARKAAQQGKVAAARNFEDAVSKASLIIVATGSLNAGEVVKKITSAYGGKTIVDISSVKSPVVRSLKRLDIGDNRVVLTHPLFGPGATTLRDKTVILTPFRNKAEEYNTAREIFKPCRIVSMKAEEHDLKMAYAMAVPRILMLSLLVSWKTKGVGVLTSSQKALMVAASTMLTEKPALIKEIVASNPYTPKALKTVEKTMKTLRNPEHIPKLCRRLRPTASELSSTYKQAYRWVEQRP